MKSLSTMTNLVITWRDIQLVRPGQRENFFLIHKTHHKARGGGVDGDGGVHYLFDFSDLVVWLSYRQLILCCVMDNIYDDVVSSLERPDLGQDHEGSLHQPDQLHLVLQQGVNYVQPFGLEVSWEKLPLFKIWSGYTLWIGKEDPRNQFETLSSAQGCSCSLSQAVEQLGYCHS